MAVPEQGQIPFSEIVNLLIGVAFCSFGGEASSVRLSRWFTQALDYKHRDFHQRVQGYAELSKIDDLQRNVVQWPSGVNFWGCKVDLDSEPS